jgi:mono/diheme cytochrome c family protein
MTSHAVERMKWVMIVAGPAVVLVVASLLALTWLPHPVPRNATSAQRLYLQYCAGCHGADGRGSWRATLFLVHPSNLADPRLLPARSDEYLFDLLKHGGATVGKPGMPAFGYHLADQQIRELVRYVRTLPDRAAAKTGR